MDAMRSIQSRGMKPNSARNPQCGTRNGMDIITANSNTRPQRRSRGPAGCGEECFLFIFKSKFQCLMKTTDAKI